MSKFAPGAVILDVLQQCGCPPEKTVDLHPAVILVRGRYWAKSRSAGSDADLLYGVGGREGAYGVTKWG